MSKATDTGSAADLDAADGSVIEVPAR